MFAVGPMLFLALKKRVIYLILWQSYGVGSSNIPILPVWEQALN